MDPLIPMMIALFAVMYFLMIRPQQKRAKKHAEMQAQLNVGERVLLTSGMFGTIAYVGERQLIVELAPGVEVTVLKGNVARMVTAADEEFEFTDEAPSDDIVVADESVLTAPADEAPALEDTPAVEEGDAVDLAAPAGEFAPADESFFQDRTAEPRAEDTK